MEQGQSSAEKELLKAIEGSMGAAAPTPPPQAAPTPPPQAAPGPSVAEGSDKAAKLAEMIMSLAGKNPFQVIKITPNEIAKVLWLAIVILSVWLGMVVIDGSDRAKKLPKFEGVQLKPQQLMTKGIVMPLREAGYYLDTILNRNIFTPFEEKKIVLPGQASVSITDMAKDLRMAGISYAEEAKDRYVMVEDTKTNVTYFLQEGDRLSNYFTVKAIYKDRAVLSHGEEEMELR